MNTLHALAEYAYIREAFIAAAVVGLVCSLMSVMIVLKRMAFIGQGIAHAGFGGMGTAALLGLTGSAAATGWAWPRELVILAFCLATLIVFSLQRLRLSSRVGGWLGRWRAGKMLAGRLSAIEEMDRQFVKFYTEHTGRMGSTILLGLIPWTLGAVEIYVVFDLLGQPISLAEAVILQAVSEMARAAVFFIPSGLGAQEGVFMLLGAAFTGSPSLGVAVALVRRMRELFWIGLGFGQGGLFSLKSAPAGPQGL